MKGTADDAIFVGDGIKPAAGGLGGAPCSAGAGASTKCGEGLPGIRADIPGLGRLDALARFPSAGDGAAQTGAERAIGAIGAGPGPVATFGSNVGVGAGPTAVTALAGVGSGVKFVGAIATSFGASAVGIGAGLALAAAAALGCGIGLTVTGGAGSLLAGVSFETICFAGAD